MGLLFFGGTTSIDSWIDPFGYHSLVCLVALLQASRLSSFPSKLDDELMRWVNETDELTENELGATGCKLALVGESWKAIVCNWSLTPLERGDVSEIRKLEGVFVLY